jgi:hypothetical protein
MNILTYEVSTVRGQGHPHIGMSGYARIAALA